jgi:predicted unusual protein kinase regulating ubiquinone biosynthesis (AarF/ABC1/UbiB family)
MPKIPRSRIGRTVKFGGMVAGQGARYLTNRSEERRGDWAMGAAEDIVATLGQMKGAAMKIGQVLSTVDFDLVPEEHREEFKAKLAELRDSSPQVPFADMRKVLEADLGGPIAEHFATFDEQAIAAASIGQVYRATTRDGRDVAVKVQYPGVAEAVETDLRNAGMLIPLVRRLAPGVDAKALLGELRDRIGEELDYEIEAQSQRRVHRAFRGHPFIVVPAVDTQLSTRRVLVTEFVAGRSFEAVKALGEEERDRFAEICFRFFYGLLAREHIAAGDPHPGNYLLADDGRVCFLDFGLIRHVPQKYLAMEKELARAVMEHDAPTTHRLLGELGYLPDPTAFEAEKVLAQLQLAGEWYFVDGFRRLDPEYVRAAIEAGSSPRSPYFEQMRRQTVPPEALLLRRMEGLLFSVLGELRAGGNWNALALEYTGGRPPSTPLGEQEAAWLGRPAVAAA